MKNGVTIRFDIKKFFFDRKAVTRRVDRTTQRVLSRFGAFVRRTSRQSIRKRKKASSPGSPPSSHIGLLKKFIYFGYDPSRESVVIGPVRLTQKGRGEAPANLEYGGTISLPSRTVEVKGQPGRDEQGRFTKSIKRKITIKGGRHQVRPRPFMQPAFEAELPKVASLWRDSVKS